MSKSSIGDLARKCRPGGAEIHHAEEEGIELALLTNPVKYLGDENGCLTGMQCVRMELGEPDDSGRRSPVTIKGSEYDIDCDLCIVAVGSGANPLLTQETSGLDLNKWGYVVVDEKTCKTTKKGVWAGGDIVTGCRNSNSLPWGPEGRLLTQCMTT